MSTSSTVNVDLYQRLNVESSATQEEIRRAYKKAALKSHPDKQKAPSSQAEAEASSAEFQAVQEAYDILSDEERRETYDRFGYEAASGNRGGGGGSGGFDDGFGFGNGNGMGFDPDDFMNGFFANMGGMGGGDPFYGARGPSGTGGGGRGKGRGRGRGRGRGQGTMRPTNVSIDYKVSLADLFNGKDTTLSVERKVSCQFCEGWGWKQGAKAQKCGRCDGKGTTSSTHYMGEFIARSKDTCPSCLGDGERTRPQDVCRKCNGEGIYKEKVKVPFVIEKGSLPGDKVVLSDKGDAEPGTQPSDLILNLILDPDLSAPFVHIPSSLDIETTIHLTLSETLLGFSRLVVTHLDGRGLKLRMPGPGEEGYRVLKEGSMIVVEGEGLGTRKSGKRGNLRLLVKVEWPNEGDMDWRRLVGDGKRLEPLLPPKRPQVKGPPTVDDLDSFKVFGQQEDCPPTPAPAQEDDEDSGWGRPGCTQQ